MPGDRGERLLVVSDTPTSVESLVYIRALETALTNPVRDLLVIEGVVQFGGGQESTVCTVVTDR